MKIVPRTARDNLVIRSARPDDAAALQRLYVQLVNDPSCIKVESDRILAIADDPNNLLLIAECDSGVVGTAFLTLCLDPMFGRQPYAVVENVAVEPTHRKQGCGRALFEVIDHFALDADCSKIMLLSGQSRTGAHRFFSSMGYLEREKCGFVKYRRQLSAPDVSGAG